MPYLVIHSPRQPPRTVPLSTEPLRIGRQAGNDCVLAGEEVSREHAMVWLDEHGRVVVRDCGSKNGTRVDGGEVFRDAERIARRSIRIGEHDLEIVESPEPPVVLRFADDGGERMGDTQFFPSTRSFDLSRERLNLLIELLERIGGVFERKELLREALDACCEALGFERGLIGLRTQRGDTELPVTRNIDRDETGAYKVSRTLINRALLHGERAIVNNPATDLAGQISESLVRFPICSALCVPILYRDEILGVIYGDRVTEASVYQPQDVDFLAAIARLVGVGLANLRMFQDHLRSKQINAELARARDIQRRLLPARPLACGRVTIQGYNEPSSAVSGDYFDYRRLEDGRISFVVADVTGHGLAAALLMANLHAAIQVTMSGKIPLEQLAARMNDLICRNTDPHVFVTAIAGRVDPDSGAIEYVSAGHPPPIVLATDAVDEPPAAGGLPWGIEPDEPYPVVTIGPDPRIQAVVLYTDGVTEAPSTDGQMLGSRRLADRLAQTHPRTTTRLIQAARDLVREHCDGASPPDDMTLLAMQFRLPDA